MTGVSFYRISLKTCDPRVYRNIEVMISFYRGLIVGWS